MRLAIITTDEDRFIEAIQNSNLNIEIVIVITNKSDSKAIEITKKYGIKCEIINQTPYLLI